MPTSLVTGGAGFLGSHLCDRLLAEGHRVICVDNLDTGTLENIEHIRDAGLRLPPARHDRPPGGRRAGRLRLPPGLAGQPDRLPAPSAAHPEGGLLRHPQRPRPGQGATGPASCWPRPARSTATPRSTPSTRATGATSTRSARAGSTTRPSATPRRSRWPTTASRASTPTSCASSTPTARACAPTTGGRSRPSSARRWPDKPLTVFGEGCQTRSFCFVSDLVEGFLRLIDCDHHEPVNIGNPGEFTILELAELILRITGSPLGDRLRGPPPGRPDRAPARHRPGARAAGLGARPIELRGGPAHDPARAWARRCRFAG